MRVVSSLHKIDSVLLSNYILKHYGPMSHLKLQKLLFYCDAYHLAYFDVELIEDKFEAWVHGPVSRKVFDSLKDKSLLYSDIEYVDNGINIDETFESLSSLQKDLLNNILSTLSTWTGTELEASTHDEKPWLEARLGYGEADRCHELISKETTRTFYKRDLNG